MTGGKLPAHMADVHIHAAIEKIQRPSQRGFGNLFAGDYAAGMAQQQL